jgi:enoyl-CoA hydratase/carnithine racemase
MLMADDDPVLVEQVPVGESGRTAAVVRLNRPDGLNPIDDATLDALDDVLDSIEADARVCTVLVTGNGRAFSAGGDLKGYQVLQRDEVAFGAFVAHLHATFGRLPRLSVPVVALVNGVAVAGGLELILNCDFALVAASARIGDGHLNFGQMGGGGVLTLLPRMIGRARAAELLLSGRLLSASDAVAWGLASRVVPDDELLGEGLAIAVEAAVKSPLALANAKRVMNELWAANGSVDESLAVELERDVDYCLNSFDAPEGLAAFAQKRPPRFEGR